MFNDEANLADQSNHDAWLRGRPDAEFFGYDPDRDGASRVRSLADIEAWARSQGIPAEPPF